METELVHPGSDPQRELDQLQAVQDAVSVEAWMPETPVWHAPLLSLAIVSVTVFTQGPAAWRAPAVALGLGLLAFGLWDTHRRRRAKPRRPRKPARIIVFYGVIVVVTFVILAATGTAVSAAMERWPDSLDRVFAAAVGLWLAGTVVFGAGIVFTERLRRRWLSVGR